MSIPMPDCGLMRGEFGYLDEDRGILEEQPFWVRILQSTVFIALFYTVLTFTQ